MKPSEPALGRGAPFVPEAARTHECLPFVMYACQIAPRGERRALEGQMRGEGKEDSSFSPCCLLLQTYYLLQCKVILGPGDGERVLIHIVIVSYCFVFLFLFMVRGFCWPYLWPSYPVFCIPTAKSEYFASAFSTSPLNEILVQLGNHLYLVLGVKCST